jgi:hypothetical protein
MRAFCYSRADNRPPFSGERMQGPTTRRPAPLVVVLAALVIGGGAVWWLARGEPRDEDPARTHVPQLAVSSEERAGGEDPEPYPPSPGEVTTLESPRSKAFTPTPAPADLDGTTLSGRVVRPGGEAVPGALVFICNTDRALIHELVAALNEGGSQPTASSAALHRYRWGTSLISAVDSDGHLGLRLSSEPIEALGGGKLLIAALFEGRDIAIGDPLPLRRGTTDFGELVLPIGAAVTLRVPFGAPPPESGILNTAAEVRVTPLEPMADSSTQLSAELLHRWVPTDGDVRIAGLVPGIVTVSVRAPGRRDVSFSGVKLSPGQVADLGTVELETGEAIAGFVVASDGSPLAQASVGVMADVQPVGRSVGSSTVVGRYYQWAYTDAQGRFVAGGLDAGTYFLFAESPGYLCTRVEGVAAGRQDVRIVLQRPATVTLTLLDASGSEPIEAAHIDVEQLPPAEPPRGGMRSVDTRVESGEGAGLLAGVYRVIGGMPDGTRLHVSAKGCARAAIDVAPLAPESQFSLTYRLARAVAVRGRVLEIGDQPIAGAAVQFAPSDEATNPVDASVVQAGGDGAFEVTDLSAGRWVCVASANGYFSSAAVEFELQADLDDALVRLTPEAQLEGRVIAVSGQPIAGSSIVCIPVEPSAPVDHRPYTPQLLVESRIEARVEHTSSDEAGHYAVEDLAPGVYLVGAARLGARDLEGWLRASLDAGDAAAPLPPGAQRVALSVGEHRTLDLIDLPLATLSGRVLVGGAPAAGATVLAGLADPAHREWLGRATCDAEGHYALGPFSPASMLVVAVVPGHALPRAFARDLEAGRETIADFNFVGQTVSGMTVLHGLHEAVGGVPLSLWWVPPDDAAGNGDGVPDRALMELVRQRSIQQPELRSDPSGRFELRQLPAGSYELQTGGSNWIAMTRPRFTVDGTWSADDIVLEVSTGTVVEGRFEVRGAGFDEAARHYEVGIYDVSANTVWAYADVEAGAYHLQGLRAGSYALRVRRMDTGGHYVFEQPVILGDDEVRHVDIVVDD